MTIDNWESGLVDDAMLGFYRPDTTVVEILKHHSQETGHSKHFAASTLQHEMYHHFQTVGTSFGIWRRTNQRVLMARVWSSLGYCVAAEKDTIWVPIHCWAEKTKSTIVRETLVHTLQGMTQASNHVLAYMGSPREPSEELSIGDVSRMSRGELIPSETVHPIVEIPGGSFHLGATAVIEGAAWFTQVTGVLHFLGESTDFDTLATKMPNQYTATMLYASHTLGPRFNATILLIASDLALWSPIGGIYEDSRYKWEDMHPGWRFVRIINAIKRMWFVPSSQHLSTPRGYTRFTERVCKVLRWNTPLQMAAGLLRAVHPAGLQDVFEQQHFDACKLRSAHPLDVFQPYASFEAQARVLLACPPLLTNVRNTEEFPEEWQGFIKMTQSDTAKIAKSYFTPNVALFHLGNALCSGKKQECPSVHVDECHESISSCRKSKSLIELPARCPLRNYLEAGICPVGRLKYAKKTSP